MTYRPRNTAALAAGLYLTLVAACQGDELPVSWNAANAPGDATQGAAGGAADPFGNAMSPAPVPLAQTQVRLPDLTEENACGATSIAAREVTVEEQVEVEVEVEQKSPVALYIMLDKSISMDRSNLWNPAVAAIGSFVNDPASAGMDLALQYFPNGGSCADGSGYDSPEVELGRLPEHAPGIEASLGRNDPDGFGTPIEGALRGVTDYCKTFQQAHPDEQCISVLVTDGRPEYAPGCEQDHQALAAIAADAFAQGVRTFAVGLSGADFALLDRIAMQGGAADCDPGDRFACEVSTGAGALLQALEGIRDTVVTVETHTEVQTHTETRAVDCAWQLPAALGSQAVDTARVNVQLTAGGAERTLGQVNDLGACAVGGWYYDDVEAPGRILACPQTCEALDGDPNASVQILLGCATMPLQ
jgi:hypothetical protein